MIISKMCSFKWNCLCPNHQPNKPNKGGHYYEKNNYDVDATIYEMLLIKAEDSTITVSGMTTDDTSGYFRRLASRYKRFNSGVLRG